nr:type I restriction-modification system subunit M N-terminal domain-containing protein [Bathymodiolus platifrons methanotrophic gill symbiont]
MDAKLWKSADKLRSNLDAANYKHVALGLIFLKYVSQARHATSQHSGTPVTNIHSPTQRMGDALVALRPSQLRTKPCSVKTTSNGWTAIRNAILASLARY